MNDLSNLPPTSARAVEGIFLKMGHNELQQRRLPSLVLSRQLKPESFNDYESVRSRIPSQHHAVPDNFKVLNGVNGFTALIPAAKENGDWIKKEDTLSVAVV